MGCSQGAVLGLLLLAVCTLAQDQQAQAPAQQQQQQMVAPVPATTFTNMAQQVAQLSTFPNTPGSLRNNAPIQQNTQASAQLQSTSGTATANQVQRGQQQKYEWAPQGAPAVQTQQYAAQSGQATSGQAAAQQQTSTNAAQQTNPNMPPQPPQLPANGPAPNPQGTINTIGSVVQAAGSLASAQQALASTGSAASSGDILQTVGQAAQALQAVQKAAGDVGNAQKSIQTGGTYVASPIPQATPAAPPTININVPGLGGNGGAPQGPPGISYSAPATQGTAYGAQTASTGTQSNDPISAIGSALAQAAFGGGLNQPAASMQAKNALGRKFA